MQHGYTISESEESFVRWRTGWCRIEIPFSTLSGHSLETFQRMCEAKGWIGDEPLGVTDEPTASSGGVLPFGTMIV